VSLILPGTPVIATVGASSSSMENSGALSVREAVRDAVDRRRRAYRIRRSAGVVRDGGHEWDADPADWVQRQRAGDPSRVG